MPIVTKIKHPNGCLIFVADGEGFEPPDGLPRQRFSRPPHSTALPTILNFFFRRSFNLRFCSLIAPDAAARHSFALGCALLALLTRTQDRRYCPALPTIHEPRSVSYSIFFKNANKIHIKNTCLVTIFSFNISASRMGIWFGAVEGPLHSAQICRNP